MSRSESTRIVNILDDHLKRYFPGGGRMVLGVSGGPDSMCLLWLLSRYDNLDLTVVHCHCQLRGDSSDKDQALVEKTASELGHEVISFRLDPLEAKGVNFQN